MGDEPDFGGTAYGPSGGVGVGAGGQSGVERQGRLDRADAQQGGGGATRQAKRTGPLSALSGC
jgi:hypothetical protein